MPARAVLQPNGLYARFSTIVDAFTDYNCTRDEIWVIFRNEGGVDCADGKVKRADEHPERFEDELETIERIHGKEEADKYRALLTKPQSELFSPFDELKFSAAFLLQLAGVDMDMNAGMKDVHTEHCCILHGCKYGDIDCTVTTKKAPQSYMCETCSESNLTLEDQIRRNDWFTDPNKNPATYDDLERWLRDGWSE